MRLKTATVIPHPSTVWAGRKSTFNGHSGSNHSGSRCDAENAFNEDASQAMTAIEAPSVIAAIAIRSVCNHLTYFRFRAASRSSVVYAGGRPMLGLRPSCEKVGDAVEAILDFSCERAAMTLNDILVVRNEQA